MAPSPQHSARTLSHKPSLLLALLCVVATACGTTAPTGKIIFDDPRGTVSLQTISDQSIQASHPINLEPALLTQLLTGIELHDEGAGRYHVKGIQSAIVGKADTYPLFSEDQVQFLAPLIAEGLRTTTANQSVEFRVVTTQEGSNRFQSPITETTTGSLYAYGRQLYVILNQSISLQPDADEPGNGRFHPPINGATRLFRPQVPYAAVHSESRSPNR